MKDVSLFKIRNDDKTSKCHHLESGGIGSKKRLRNDAREEMGNSDIYSKCHYFLREEICCK